MILLNLSCVNEVGEEDKSTEERIIEWPSFVNYKHCSLLIILWFYYEGDKDGKIEMLSKL